MLAASIVRVATASERAEPNLRPIKVPTKKRRTKAAAKSG